MRPGQQKKDYAKEFGATIVITHRVQAGQHAAYETWLEEIVPLCQSQPGHIDTQFVRPIAGVTETYTVIIRFDTDVHANDWLHSDLRQQTVDKVRPMLEEGDDFVVRSGIEFLFTASELAPARAPTRWKQFLLTWSVIYPLVLIVPLAITALLRPTGLQDERLVVTLLATGVIVALMVYWIMPRYTRLVHDWLFR